MDAYYVGAINQNRFYLMSQKRKPKGREYSRPFGWVVASGWINQEIKD
jgi:hypothetical protein